MESQVFLLLQFNVAYFSSSFQMNFLLERLSSEISLWNCFVGIMYTVSETKALCYVDVIHYHIKHMISTQALGREEFQSHIL